MHLIEFKASEYVEGEVELDWDTALDEEEAKEIAVKEIAALYPEYYDIEIIRYKEI